MKPRLVLKSLTAGMALLTSVCAGTASANEEFGMLAGIPAETISQEEMKAVEGKFLTALPVLGSTGLLNSSGKGSTLAKGKVNIPTGQRLKINLALKPMGKKGNGSLVQSLQLPIIGQLPALGGVTDIVKVVDLGNILGGSGLPVVGQLPIISSLGGLGGLTNLVQVSNLTGILSGGGFLSGGGLPIVGQLPIIGQLPVLSSVGGLTNLVQVSNLTGILSGGGLPVVGQLPIVGGLTSGVLGGGGLPIVGGLTSGILSGGLPVVGQLPIVSSLPIVSNLPLLK